MTSILHPICVDSNLVLRLVLGGPHAEPVRRQWKKWIYEDRTLIAPTLFAFEITSVVWREVYQGRLTLERGRKALQTAIAQDVRLEYPDNLHEQAFEITSRFNLPQAYDAHYVALAERFGCEFWTLDKTLYEVLSPKLPWVRTIPAKGQEMSGS